ncbi:hypothetical protein BC567DRAFT_210005 [Phyllosticta citribraziliensis]
MAVLALKALSYGADKLPDKIFEALPGGYFKRKEEKLRKKEQKLRSQSEGRGRHRRSPSYSDEDDDYYSSDYYTSGDEFEREHRNRRKERRSDSSDEKDHRGRERERRRSHHGRLRSFDRYADEDIPPDLDPRAHSQGAEYYRTHFMPPQIQPYGQQQPPISAADEIYAHPQPHNPAAYTHAKPYNPAEYGHGQLNLPQTHAASNLPSHPNGHAISVQGQTVPVTHGQTVSPQNMTPQTQAQTNPASMQQQPASSSVSRHSSIHSSTNGGAHGGHGHHSRAKNESRRRHSIAVNTDPRLRSPYHPAYSRTAASSVTGSRQASRAPSRTGSNRNGVGERIQEGSGFDGARDYDSPRSVAAAGTLGAIAGGLVGDAFVPGAAVGTVLGAAAGGLGTSEVARRRLGRTYGGGRCDGAMRKSRREKGRNHSASVEDVTDEHFMG